MAQAKLLVEIEEENDENRLLLNFFQANSHVLSEFPLHQIPHDLKKEIAADFYGTAEDKDDWIGVLEDLGVNKTTIYIIDFISTTRVQFPLVLAINGILRRNNRSLGDFINVLHKKGKLRILGLLKPFVEGLRPERHSLKEGEHYFEPLPSAPNYSSLEVTCSSVDSCGSRGDYSAPEDTRYGSLSCQEIKGRQIKDHKTELEHSQNSESTSFGNNKQLYGVSNSLNSNQSVVFIMHSKSDKKYAMILAAWLKKKNFEVFTSADIYDFLEDNYILIMKAVHEQAHFIVPVISEAFLKQIECAGSNATRRKDIESEANSFLYNRLLNECSSLNNNRNRRVKPVVYSREIREPHKLDEILQWPGYIPYTDLKNDEVLESELLQRLRFFTKRKCYR